MIKAYYIEQLYSEINDLKKRPLSTRVNSVLSMIENEIKDQPIFDSHKGEITISILQGNDFGMVFQSIVFIPKELRWAVISREGKGQIYFETLVDVMWYIRCLHRPMKDAIYEQPL